MGILLDEPKFPVIERAPSAATTISNFNLTDWLRVTAVTSASIPVGFLAGAIRNCLSLFPLSVLHALFFLYFQLSGNLRFNVVRPFSRALLNLRNMCPIEVMETEI